MTSSTNANLEQTHCLRCHAPMKFNAPLCKECVEEEEFMEAERERGPQTLVDVGMCEGDFR
jgi:predicted amidophosphoribosyltransferase